jgi:hypothetical protein
VARVTIQTGRHGPTRQVQLEGRRLDELDLESRHAEAILISADLPAHRPIVSTCQANPLFDFERGFVTEADTRVKGSQLIIDHLSV